MKNTILNECERSFSLYRKLLPSAATLAPFPQVKSGVGSPLKVLPSLEIHGILIFR
jgi:hypothetical protein